MGSSEETLTGRNSAPRHSGRRAVKRRRIRKGTDERAVTEASGERRSTEWVFVAACYFSYDSLSAREKCVCHRAPDLPSPPFHPPFSHRPSPALPVHHGGAMLLTFPLYSVFC